MNLSLTCLSFTNFFSTSSFMMNSLYKRHDYNNIFLSNFFFSFFVASFCPFSRVSLKQSHFRNFLNVPVKIQNSYINNHSFKNQIFHKGLAFENDDMDITISSCSFIKCKSRAINIEEERANININKCIFDGCSIFKNGGAIFSKALNFNCSYSYFQYCDVEYAGFWGSAAYIYKPENVVLTYISTFQCPPCYSDRNLEGEICVFGGNADCQHHNYTMGKHVLSSGLKLRKVNEKNLKVQFIINNLQNTGSSISLTDIYGGHISYLNFINNTCSRGLLCLYKTDFCLSYSNFINNIGNTTFLIADAKITLISCHFDAATASFGSCTVSTISCAFNDKGIKISPEMLNTDEIGPRIT